ncbi:MAG TPA: steroid delta-isomerase [Bacillus bacterium]|nr:steroid delta-isomerase [Bacillus sp. (in: firmicutes)]
MDNIGAILAQKQLDAYNKQDLEGFLSVYSEDVEILEFPSNNVMTRGIEDMKIRYEKLFKENPNNHAELLSRIVHDNKVIDHEYVTGRNSGVEKNAVAIYEIQGDKIVKVWFL